jgi:hypothetical protein
VVIAYNATSKFTEVPGYVLSISECDLIHRLSFEIRCAELQLSHLHRPTLASLTNARTSSSTQPNITTIILNHGKLHPSRYKGNHALILTLIVAGTPHRLQRSRPAEQRLRAPNFLSVDGARWHSSPLSWAMAKRSGRAGSAMFGSTV